MLSQGGIRIYLILQIFLANHISLSSVIAKKYIRKAAKQERPHECSLIKAHTSDKSCFLNIWHGDETHSSQGIDNYKKCYDDSKACFSVEVGYQGNAEGGKCNFNVRLNDEIMEKGDVQDTYFRIGDCGKSVSCEGQKELILRDFPDKNLNYSHHIVGQSGNGWDYSTSENLVDGESGSICIDIKKCNVLQSNEGSYGNYYLLEGKTVLEQGDLNNFQTFGDCSDKLFLFINTTYDGVGFNYTLTEDDQLVRENIYLEAGKVDSIFIDTKKCTTISGIGNASYEIFHNGELETGIDHSDYYVFGKCTCNYKPLPLIDSTRGYDIFEKLSSIWGMQVFIDVTTPQYVTACWLIKYDQLSLNVDDTNIIQRYVMGLLFYATDGWNWSKYKGFMSSKHECYWNDGNWNNLRSMGVVCNVDNVLVQAIGLANNNLDGILISEIYTLSTDLQALFLAGNRLSGTLPVSMRDLNLQVFDIESNNFHGKLPKDLFSMIGTVQLSSNNFTGTLPNVDMNSALKFLDISDNKISGTIPAGIGRASELTRLNLSLNQITGKIPSSITSLEALTNLYLNKNFLTGYVPSQISTLILLQVINLSYNHLSGVIPSGFGKDHNLTDLALNDNHFSGSIPMDTLIESKKLQRLFLSNNNLNGSIALDSSNWSATLEILYIQKNHITGTIQDCNETVVRADCDIPRKVMCECCQCFGIYDNPLDKPLAYEEEFPLCSSSELNIIFDNDKGDVIAFDLKNEANELLSSELSISETENMNYRSCISETDCYVLESHPSKGKNISYDLIINSTTVAKNDESVTRFGYSGTNTLTRATCDNYTICNITLVPGTENRTKFNSLFKNIHSLSDFDDENSSHYKALCWWLKDEESATELRNPIQRYLLALLYYRTSGEEWFNDTNWKSQESECEWYGITCNGDSTLITKINLDSNNLAGHIPTELGELRGLESLVLSSNNLTGLLAHEMTKLEMLEVLNISSNTLKGSLTPYIHFFSHLTKIDLSSNIFTGTLPTTISYLTNIQHINLSNNSFSGKLPSQLSNFSKLEVLNVSNNLFQGNILMLQDVRNLTQLDLSSNYFTGQPPIFGYTHSQLEILIANGNVFSGSISTLIGKMRNLTCLHLHSNNLIGTLPPEIGGLKNISSLSLSYNKIKQTIPTEIGKLTQLKLLHLHSNRLTGTADHFDKHNKIGSFITDCGNTATTEKLVECEHCTVCCNEDNECIEEDATWPKYVLKDWNVKYSFPTAVGVFVFTLIWWISMVFIAWLLNIFKYKLPELSYVYHEDRFQSGSVYRFFLASSKRGWIIASLTICFQLWITYTFFQAGDRTSKINEWVFSMDCPSNSIKCDSQLQTNTAGWLTFSAVLALFVVPDVIDGIYLFYESCTSREFHFCKLSVIHLRVVFGILLMSVPTMSIFASFLYLYATSTSNAALLKDSIVILFLSEIDEQTFKVIVRLFPSWNDSIEQDILDIFNHHYDTVTEEQGNDRSAIQKTEEDIDMQDDDTFKMMASAAKKGSEDLSKDGTTGDLIGIAKCPETKEVLQKNCIDALTFQVEKLTNQMHAKDLIIVEIWNVLSREHFQFTDPTMNKAMDVIGLNTDTELSKTSQHVKKQQLKEVKKNTSENDSKCSPLTPFQLNSLSVRQAMAQELDTKIRDTLESAYCARRSSLDIFENKEVQKESLGSSIYEINRSNEQLDKSKNSSLVSVTKEAKAQNNNFKSYPMPSLDTPHTEVAPSTYAISNDNFFSEGKIIAHPDPTMLDDSYKNKEKLEYQKSKVDSKTKNYVSKNTETADDTIVTTLADPGNVVSQSKANKCDSGEFFHSLDFELNASNKDQTENVVFMKIDAPGGDFEGNRLLTFSLGNSSNKASELF